MYQMYINKDTCSYALVVMFCFIIMQVICDFTMGKIIAM